MRTCHKVPVKLYMLANFFIAFCFCCTTLTSCSGYRFGANTGLTNSYKTISVPYIEGDLDGSLTSAVISELVRSGAFEYRHCGGALILKAKLIDWRDENIGFRYDRKKQGELRHAIIPTETRRTSYVEVVVEDRAAGCIVSGPVQLSASADFDHDYEYARNEVNVFSLGQLSDFDAACDAVQTPLNQALARKIVDYVIQSW